MLETLPSARRLNFAYAGAAAALFCTGCDAVPGTSSYRESKAKRAVTQQLIDPLSAQFRNVQVRGGSVCGEVNGKNKMGAYVGYSRFVVDTTKYEALIDPQFDYSDLLSARDLCTQMTGNEYSSLSSTLSTCERATELEGDRRNQEAFDQAWTASCAGGSGRGVFRPPLPDNASGENLSTAALTEAGSADDHDAAMVPHNNPPVDDNGQTAADNIATSSDDNLALPEANSLSDSDPSRM